MLMRQAQRKGAKMFTATFPLVKRAEDFAERIAEGGFSAEAVVRKGRTVTWNSTSDSEDYFLDLLETVGYYGSDERRKATMNGVKAPMSY